MIGRLTTQMEAMVWAAEFVAVWRAVRIEFPERNPWQLLEQSGDHADGAVEMMRLLKDPPRLADES